MKVTPKWRPPLWLVVAAVVGLVLCLPLAGLFLFNFYSKQLVQQTEEALIAQATVLAAVYAQEFERLGGNPAIGQPVPDAARPDAAKAFHPIFPKLSVRAGSIGPSRPDAGAATGPAQPLFREIGARLTEISVAAQDRTLAGFRIVDTQGRVIGGTGEVGRSLAHVDEVSQALEGYPVTLLRERGREERYAMPWSLNRSTAFRVFVSLPVIVEDHVVGAIYLSRTPGNVIQYMFLERANLMRASAAVLGAAIFIGFVFWRFITRPIYGLIEQTQAVSEGSETGPLPLPHYGTREVATLGQSFISMAGALQRRAESVETFTAHVTHELKSPLTSILGAAELLSDGNADPAMQKKLLSNISQDAERMTLLLDRLRKLASARISTAGGRCDLRDVLGAIRGRFESLQIEATPGPALPIAADDLKIILTHMAENAEQHGATRLEIRQDGQKLHIRDDGGGISPENAGRIFDPFFTTRREDGGTGMGLGIVAALVEANGEHISLEAADRGAAFTLDFGDAPT